MKCLVSAHGVRRLDLSRLTAGFDAQGGQGTTIWANIPCVTKLPKFLPTIQCHVAPAFRSNYIVLIGKIRSGILRDFRQMRLLNHNTAVDGGK